MDVFLTFDVEIWCGGWQNLDENFSRSFDQYIYGRTDKGDYGLPFALEMLEEYDLRAVFFVEPLFATRFGLEPLKEIVGLLLEKDQEIDLHLHTEWVDEAREALLAKSGGKRQHLKYFSVQEQSTLVAKGIQLLRQAGASDIAAFRAGNFAFNLDTLCALAENGIEFDSSYNASLSGTDSGLMPGILVVSPIEAEGVYEYPMTVFKDGTGSLRHVQITACSYREMEGLLWQALEDERDSFVILSHNFELLNRALNRPDWVVVERFRKLCSLLQRNQDCFRTRGFKGLIPKTVAQQQRPLVSPLWKTAARILEQIYRRRYE
ncbi:MAG: polysaccharide deacetylase [Desulfobacteraceae bacterium]|nr:MAG: polysaccharide deacetylase [Desulfobacteraceae bacterium]